MRLPRYRLRTLMLAVVIVAVSLGVLRWWTGLGPDIAAGVLFTVL
jgi:hypothetical protein